MWDLVKPGTFIAVALGCAVGTSAAGVEEQPPEAPKQHATEAVLDAVYTEHGLDWRYPYGKGHDPRGVPPGLGPQEWAMLVEEARDVAGAAPEAELTRFLTERGIDDTAMKGLVEHLGVHRERLNELYADYLAVARLREVRLSALRVTESDIEELISKTQDRISFALSVLRGSKLVRDDEEIPEAELRQVFEQYRDAKFDPAHGRIGYRMGWRIQVEYLGLAIEDLLPSIKVTEEDAKARFDRSLKEDGWWLFGGFTDGNQYKYEVCRDSVYERLKDERALEIAERGLAKARGILQEPWADAKVVGWFKQTPDEVKKPGYWQGVVDRLKSETGLPWRTGKSKFVSKKNASEIPDVGQTFRRSKVRARTNLRGRHIAFRFAAFDVEGVVDPDRMRNPEFLLAMYEPCPAPIYSLKEAEPYNQFFYRVVATRAPGPPESLEEVRQYVQHDARTIRGMERVKPHANRLARAAREKGLEAAWTEDSSFVELFSEKGHPQRIDGVTQWRLLAQKFARITGQAASPSDLEQVHSSQKLLDEVFSFARAHHASDPTTRPPHPVMLARLDQDHAYAVVELLDYRPFSVTDAEMVGRVRYLLYLERGIRLTAQLGSPLEVRRRWEARHGGK